MEQSINSAASRIERAAEPASRGRGGSILSLLLADASHSQSRVRVLAVRELSDYQDSLVVDRLLELAAKDPDLEVRSAAILGLGNYIYRGGISAYDPETDQEAVHTDECLSREDFCRVYEFLLAVYRDENRSLDERRYAVEAQSFFGNETVEDLIADLYARPEKAAKRSALTAMGRNGSERWVPILRRAFYGSDRDLCLDAIVAAGETSLTALGKDLWRLTYSDNKDVMLAAVWSLGQTGWSGAFERLDELTLDEDPDVAHIADEAMDEWLFYNGLSSDTDDPDTDDDEESLLLG